jgi:hypothetical protein
MLPTYTSKAWKGWANKKGL